MDGDVVAELPGFFQEGSDRYDFEWPSGQGRGELRGLLIVQDTPENVAPEDLGDFYVEVFDRPKVDPRSAPERRGEGFTFRSVLEDVNASRGIEDVPARHRSVVGVSLLRENVCGRPVADDSRQMLPPRPPFVHRLRVGRGGDLDDRIVYR